jgi:hypothetical protein
MSQSVLGSSSLISQLLGADRSITATFFATRLSRISIDPVRTTQSSLHQSGSGDSVVVQPEDAAHAPRYSSGCSTLA